MSFFGLKKRNPYRGMTPMLTGVVHVGVKVMPLLCMPDILGFLSDSCRVAAKTRRVVSLVCSPGLRIKSFRRAHLKSIQSSFSVRNRRRCRLCLLTSPDSKQFEDQTWDEYNDVCSVKTFNRTDNAVSKVKLNRWCGACFRRLSTPFYFLPFRL